jgi:hypothetical protein
MQNAAWSAIRKCFGMVLLAIKVIIWFVFWVLLLVVFSEAVTLVITSSNRHVPGAIGWCILSWFFWKFLQYFEEFFDRTMHRIVPEWEEDEGVAERPDAAEQNKRAVS